VTVFASDLVSMLRDRIARTDSERELARLERMTAGVRLGDVALLETVGGDIDARRQQLSNHNNPLSAGADRNTQRETQ
jgi:hypothetical protein